MIHGVILFSLLAGAVLLVLAAVHDVAVRTVPNWMAGVVALAGLVAQGLQGQLLISVAAALSVFVLAALCWRRGWMGGGDVKLLGAAALLVPPETVPMLLAATSLSGGLLAVVYLISRRRIRRPGIGRPDRLILRAVKAERWRLRRGGPMPYAVAIASGAFFVLSHGGLP